MIVVAGEALIDGIVYADGRVRELFGGGPYNTARTVARLGGRVAFLGRLSTDERGQRLRAALRADGVDLRWADTTGAPTTRADAALDATGQAHYEFSLHGTSASDLSWATVAKAIDVVPSAMHIGTLGLVMEPIASVLAEAVTLLPDDTLLMVDPNCRPTAIPDRAAYLDRLGAILRRADVVKVSVDDLAYLAPGRSSGDAAVDLLAMGVRVVLLTDGGRAARIVTADFASTIPVPSMPVVDTIGAGDAFSGGFVAHWIETGRGREHLVDRAALEQATRFGVVVAGLTCGRAGADPPTAAEMGEITRRVDVGRGDRAD